MHGVGVFGHAAGEDQTGVRVQQRAKPTAATDPGPVPVLAFTVLSVVMRVAGPVPTSVDPYALGHPEQQVTARIGDSVVYLTEPTVWPCGQVACWASKSMAKPGVVPAWLAGRGTPHRTCAQLRLMSRESQPDDHPPRLSAVSRVGVLASPFPGVRRRG
ncbi:MAG TPA: hypothetical protein VJT72_19665 [Pseudonocardiaceae bacterium]|nr:hypothetical protein [Pseudonocardiaceae bacterium]